MLMTFLVGAFTFAGIFALIWATTVNKWIELVCVLIVMTLAATTLSYMVGMIVLTLIGGK
jgi:hypothetical protein